jgi:hypothetical protein
MEERFGIEPHHPPDRAAGDASSFLRETISIQKSCAKPGIKGCPV